MPTFLPDVKWEMASWELEETHRLRLIHSRDFREVYQESNHKLSSFGVDNIIFYFAVIEGRGDRPLYEVIVDFTSEEARDNYAHDHLGEPNTENGEWDFTTEGAHYRAWKFQKKLVVVKVIPGCEWDE
ncbi:hypothetical protein [Phaeocystidibacter marisrubri]|uniref:Uncharacterized protein n=1 Tax=Phaeocystidibacter marisrubri TaxID=1577780 RepID=A0A6L3ZF16_9FLAO|nr:hypothetical protein [Phaeocystidibacter marisrubri]KAB2816188.1 hypothetical protein F8C82_10905 [Phaeocystidibacter marisrubri]